jgi:hypothetical protein
MNEPYRSRWEGRNSWPVSLDPVFGCELWTGAVNNNGRPIIWRGPQPSSAIRIAFQREGIAIPADQVPDHLCRRIACVSLAHLELVTKQENERRKSLRYRLQRKRCRNGHALSEATRIVTPEMGVLCRLCRKAAA